MEKDAEEEDECNDKLESLEMTVPQLMGDAEGIQLLKSSNAVKNLGFFARPHRCSNKYMSQTKGMMEDWTVRVKNGKLPTRSV